VTTVVELSVVTPTVVELTVVDGEVTVGSTSPSTVEIVGVEAAGPRGPQGDPGELGPSGLSAYEVALLEGFVGTEEEWLESLVGPQGAPGGSYTHLQGATSDTWVMVHNLGYRPAVSAFDSGDTQVLGEITHDSVNQTTVRFANAFSGVAYLS
jgi:hypothetical protein